MKPLQNTLYITTPESYLFWENECIAVKIACRKSKNSISYN